MPTIITRGAASAKSFGFTNASGGANVKYLILGSSGQVYSTTTPNLQTAGIYLNSGVTTINQESYEFPAVIANGNFIATNNYYSKDNGASWTLYKQLFVTSTIQSTAIGVNGGFAICPTNNNILSFTPRFDYAKGGSYSYLVGYNGTSVSNAVINYTTGYQPRNVVYCSALGGFYASLIQGQTWFIYENSLGTPYSVSTQSGISQYLPYVNSSGYYVAPYYNGSSFFYRTFNSQDLSSYSSTTSITGSNRPLNSAPVWHPATGKYYMVGFSSAGGSSQIYFQESTDGASFSLKTTISTSTSGFRRLSFNFTSDTDFVIQGYAYFYGKSGYTQSPASYYSSDAGVNWSAVGNPTIGAWVASCKNLTL